MKKGFEAETKGTKKARKISLKWKWSLGAAAAIFLTYILFTVIIFFNFRQIMLSQQDEKLKEILYGVEERLNLENDKLTKARVYQALSPSYTPSFPKSDDSYDQRNLLIGEEGNFQDTLYAEMSGDGVVVRVYSPTSRLLFETKPSDVSFNAMNKTSIDIVDIKDKTGIIGVKPIYSSRNQNLIGYIQVTNQLVDYHEMSEKFFYVIIFAGIVALIFSAVLGFLLATSFLKPIKTITNTMNDIRKDTQSQSRISISEGNDELTHLSDVFNDMLDKMQLYIEQQKQFVEDVSHELRTPVAVVEGHLKLLNRWGKNDPEILEESLSASLQETERMKTLVQEMLDLSRAEQVEIHYKNEKTSIRQVVLQSYNNFKLIYPDFTFIFDDDLISDVYVSIYRNHLEQILTILLDNAVKYSTDRKEVHISLAKQERFVQIAIQDYGEGMEQADTEKVFGRFYRVDKARSRYKGGNGLGLSIARELLNGYKGNITVDSALGHGSIFRITLPLYFESTE